MRILGLDPGSRITGIGIIDEGKLVHCESLRLGGGAIPERLGAIFARLVEVIEIHQPTMAAVETVFMSRNAQAAIKLGQARGAAIAALVASGLEVHEYAPREIKQALVGRGGAEKGQVQHMVGILLGLKEAVGEDAADALAVALCHHHMAQTARRLPPGVKLR